ncbi:MAG: transporter substrate-binding protein [Devosia sp.]|nr:transporter substrate-binding protein [Devosia sp.]
MKTLGQLIARAATAAGLLGLANVALASEELVVLTSFPPSFYEVFVERFAQSHPELQIKVIQRSTASGVHFLLERPQVDVDLFWVSSPDAFELLKSEEQLMPVPFNNPTTQTAIAGHPVHDPEAHYYGFAFSTYGVAYNSQYLAAHGLEMPRQWQDLAAPGYAGHLGITSPARSGTSHFIVEAILQTFGWNEGWAMLSRMGGNLSTITARSFGVLDGIEQARFGLGPTIDFLAFSGGPPHDKIGYRALEPLFLAPASIAALQRSQNREAAIAFINFLMSPEGQRLLMDPEIGRIPVDDELRAAALAQQGLVLAEARSDDSTVFDAALSARRYELVNIIFDEWVVANRQALSDNWQRIVPDAPEHAPASALLSAPPIAEARANEIMASGLMRGASGDSLMSEEQQAVHAEIRSAVQANIAAAEAILNTRTEIQVERN